jgi:REP element-mobilizing transposase RayT
MARKLNNYKPNTYYHIFNRGHNKKVVFRQDRDKATFINNLFFYSKKFNIEVDSYCLMRTHFHLILKTGRYPKHLSGMMQAFMTKFCVYINKKYHMVGAVFQGRYKKREIKDFEDLLIVRTYLWQNPVKKEFVESPGDYKWMRIGGHT